jgi:predicted phosphohydrolase
MTRIKLISDVHTEFCSDQGRSICEQLPNEGVDILVIAGDLTSKYHEENLSILCDRFPNTVYVPGNHDYWGSSFAEFRDKLAGVAAKISNLHWLDNRRVQVGEHFFAGTTLWFPREECPFYTRWIDFIRIVDGANGVYDEHEKAYKFLNENVQAGDIVVTHHLPSNQCVAPQWQGADTNCFFVGGAEDIILRKAPAYWFYGHTHTPGNLQIWQTQLVCNPRGYPGEGVPFNPDLIIDTDLDKRT